MSANMQTATGIAEQFLYQQLSGDGTITSSVGSQIYAQQAPQGATYPLIVYAALGPSSDTTALGFSRVLTNLRYVVRAADRVSSIANLDLLVQRIDQLLHGQKHVGVGGGAVLACTRIGQIELAGADAGVSTRDLGNIYSIQVQEGTS